MTAADAADLAPRCRVCGRTDDEACDGGCWWVPDLFGDGDICSRCAELEAEPNEP
jgi:hypothetical protein